VKEEQLFRFLGSALAAVLIAGASFSPALAASTGTPGDSARPAATAILSSEAQTADWAAPEYHLIAPDTRAEQRTLESHGTPATEADLKMWLGDGKTIKDAKIRRFANGILNRTSTIAKGLTRSAMRFIGTPYVFGGTSSRGFDCSGYIQHVFAMMGIHVPRTADLQYYAGRKINGAMTAGDLVFFQTYEPGPSHVGIYLGAGKFVHASSHGVMVSHMRDSYWSSRYVGVKRVVQAKT